MTQDTPNGPKKGASSIHEPAPAPAQRGVVGRQIHLIGRLLSKAGQVTRHLVTSPAIRSHVISIIQSEGLPGIIRRLRRMRSNLARVERTAAILQIKSLNYEAWSQRFDTPDADDCAALLTAIADRQIACTIIVGHGERATLEKSLLALKQSIRKPDSLRLAFTNHIPADERATLQSLCEEANAALGIEAQKSDADCTIIIPDGFEIRPHTLALMAAEFVQNPALTLVYGDEARSEGGKLQPWFKPRYSPLMARSGRLLTGPVAFNHYHAHGAEYVKQIHISANDYDHNLIGWSIAQPRHSIGHIPHVLATTDLPLPERMNVTPLLTTTPIVSLIIPTRNFWSVLKPCLDSLKNTDWPSECLDIIVVDNGSDDPETLKGLIEREQNGEIRVIRHDRPFNWSELNNIGAAHAKGSVLVFLNNDIEIIEADWLKKLVAFASLPQAGAVGCKLLYPDRTIQHGGVVIGIQGVAGHAHLFLEAKDEGYYGLANTSREISAVTGACIAIEKTKFDAVGGFDESFRIAFNDIAFCVTLSEAGFDNIYVADAILLHHESKSRGYDTTPEKIERNRLETIAFWHKFQSVIRDDRYYSPNLSYRETYKLSNFPRRMPAWAAFRAHKPRVLMLSITHAKGHGVPVVLAMQAEALVKAGYDVIVAGPQSGNDFPYEGCRFLEVHDPESAALAAHIYRVDCVVAHTPPFFSSVRWLGSDCPFIAYDYGEPPPDWFDDADARRDVNNEKETCLAMADRVYAISNAIRDESNATFNGVIRLGNSHLGIWTADAAMRRNAIREQFGFKDRFIILNVCRFQRGERRYKGVDHYVETMRAFQTSHPELAARCTFVLCGKGAPKDVKEMQLVGLNVYPNVTDETMSELYIGADAYMNFSQWEGYNLGVAQALAMGLPTFASDIPAHRAFGIKISNDTHQACAWLAERLTGIDKERELRRAQLWTWDEPLADFVSIVSDTIKDRRS